MIAGQDSTREGDPRDLLQPPTARVRRDVGEVPTLVRGELDAERIDVGGVAWRVGSEAAGPTVVGPVSGRDSTSSERDLFDLASLSKPFTATLALRLAAAGLLDLDVHVGDVVSSARGSTALPESFLETTLEELLRHRARLPAWRPLYDSGRGAPPGREPEDLVRWVGAIARDRTRLGTYSDLGYIAYAALAEIALGQPMVDLLRRHVVEPLGCSGQLFGAESVPRERVYRCGLGTAVEVRLAASAERRVVDLGPPERGEAQDGNARWLGRYSGHAGLFGTLQSALRLGEEWLHALRGEGQLLERDRADDAVAGRGVRRLGWWRSTLKGAGGPALDRSAFGHTGFTGGSLWIDPSVDLVCTFLAHRSSVEVDLQPARRRLHSLVVSGASSPSSVD